MCYNGTHSRCQHANAYMYVSMRAPTGAIHLLVSATKYNKKLSASKIFFFFFPLDNMLFKDSDCRLCFDIKNMQMLHLHQHFPPLRHLLFLILHEQNGFTYIWRCEQLRHPFYLLSPSLDNVFLVLEELYQLSRAPFGWV